MAEQNLHSIAMMEALVGEATQEMFNQNLEITDQISKTGLLIADQVVIELRTAKDVRAAATSYSRLDFEAFLVSGGDIESFRDNDQVADYIEATGRRLGHHSYRLADSLIGSWHLRQQHSIRQARRINQQFGFVELSAGW